MHFASASETFRQRIIFSVASRFLLAGRKIQIKLAKPRPNFRQNFSGNRQIILLSNFKNLYSMSATLLCAVYSAGENFFLPPKIFSRRPKIFPPPEDFFAARRFFRRPKIFPPPEDFSVARRFFTPPEDFSVARRFFRCSKIFPPPEDFFAARRFFRRPKIFPSPEDFHAARRFSCRPKIFTPPEDFHAARRFSCRPKIFSCKKNPLAHAKGFISIEIFLTATIRRGRWRRCRRVITSAVAIIGRGRRCPGRIITSAVTIGRRRVVSVIVAIMGSRRRGIAVPTLPIFAVAAFVFGLAPEQMFVPEVRPRSCLLRFDLRVQVVDGCCLRLSAEENRACRHGD